MSNTAGHFWLMVWEQKSRAVIMLNRIYEKGQVAQAAFSAILACLNYNGYAICIV